MSEQVQKEHTTQKTTDDTPAGDIPGAEARDRAKTVSDATADLLDEIDDLLNELPQGLVENYKQVGGQ